MPPLRRSPPSSPSDGEGGWGPGEDHPVKRTLFPGDGHSLGRPTSVAGGNYNIGGRGGDGVARLATLALAVLAIVASVSLLATVVTMDMGKLVSHVGGDGDGDDDDDGDYLDPDPDPSFDTALARAIRTSSIGSLGPSGTNRNHMRYYDALFYAALQYGIDAKSILEVGCASDAFVRHLNWIDDRTCVAPYFESYEKYASGGGGGNVVTNNNATDSMDNIVMVTADFMQYPVERTYDLLLCNQVLEHVPNPAKFMKKLIDSARTSIISVPYNWEDCGKECAHVSHRITHKTLLRWSAPHVPIYQGIVTDNATSNFGRRTILVFKKSSAKGRGKKAAKRGGATKKDVNTETRGEASPVDFFTREGGKRLKTPTKEEEEKEIDWPKISEKVKNEVEFGRG
ncbi:hypothetical protein ACHAXA_009063 [Cyclostephanos tholiformis]|uniref:Methyltransferase type 11 domain-containing protein n=1 Tax=Cyclostephanos tholiformis TaxID=382380 RepID=A0ABD3RP41_9STRA